MKLKKRPIDKGISYIAESAVEAWRNAHNLNTPPGDPSLAKLVMHVRAACVQAFAFGQSESVTPYNTVNPEDMKVKPALLLDFDGTIRRSKSGKKFIEGKDDIELFPDVQTKLIEYRRDGWLIAGVTNQGGVAFGIRSSQQIVEEIAATLDLFNIDAPFDFIKVALHHPGGSFFPFNYRSLMRKPDIGMLQILELNAFNAGVVIDWDHSMMVGDREEDQILARNAGIKFEWADDFFNREGMVG